MDQKEKCSFCEDEWTEKDDFACRLAVGLSSFYCLVDFLAAFLITNSTWMAHAAMGSIMFLIAWKRNLDWDDRILPKPPGPVIAALAPFLFPSQGFLIVAAVTWLPAEIGLIYLVIGGLTIASSLRGIIQHTNEEPG